MLRALAAGNQTRTQLIEVSGLHSSTVGKLLRAMLRPGCRCIHISDWVVHSFTPHNATTAVIKRQPAFSLGIAPDAEIPAHLAHYSATSTYD